MKIIRKIRRKLVEIPFTWAILNSFYRLFARFDFEKKLIKIEQKAKITKEQEDKLKIIFSDLTVLDGPFKGMKYPDFIAYGSAMYPKLLGAYECEIYPEMEKLLKNDYHTIWDIGCAEGYYAVGFAMCKSNATIYAYDTDEVALNACKKMAALNNVEKQMRFGNFCSQETLTQFDFSKRSLIMSDCEGFEMELFTPEVVKNLINCDLIIELHDLYNEKVSPTVEDTFRDTQHMTFVYSKSTFKKMRAFELSKQFSDEQIAKFFTERNGIMQWVFMTPKV